MAEETYRKLEVPVGPGELQHLADHLTAADWLTNAALTDTHLTGQLTGRVLPLTCPLPWPDQAEALQRATGAYWERRIGR